MYKILYGTVLSIALCAGAHAASDRPIYIHTASFAELNQEVQFLRFTRFVKLKIRNSHASYVTICGQNFEIQSEGERSSVSSIRTITPSAGLFDMPRTISNIPFWCSEMKKYGVCTYGTGMPQFKITWHDSEWI